MEQLLAYLESLNVKLWVEGERLRYKDPLRVLTPERLEQLRERKAEIIQFLQNDTQRFNSAQPKVQQKSPLVGIQPFGSRAPFFCIHPLSGNILIYLELARHLGTEQPFYGLEAFGVDEKREPLTTVEEMASCYIEAISVVQPSGPYFLGGFSFGGMVAFEMAQQLQQRGQEVALLAIMDTPAPVPNLDDPLANNQGDWLKLLSRNIERQFGKELPIDYEHFQKLQLQEQLDYFLELLKAANLISPELGQEAIHRLLNVWIAISKAAISYVPRVYKGQITLFQSSEKHPRESKVLAKRLKEYGLGWSEFTTEPIEIHPVPGDHLTMLTAPHCQVVADKLNYCLERAQAG